MVDLKKFRVCVVGSGFYGAVIAERVSRELNMSVLVLERRNHIGGNSYSRIDQETGIEIHQYGSHIFHTSDRKIWKYINQFSSFNDYRHRVLSVHQHEIFSMPINLGTINQFYKKSFSPEEARQYIEEEIARTQILHPKNFEERAKFLIGTPLYEAFIKGYSEKQWGVDLTLLPESIINRLPVRYDFNDRYFDDEFEGLPLDGYSAIFTKMLTHPKIQLLLNTDFFSIRSELSPDCLIVYTGPIDRFYEFEEGRLGWRTITLEQEVHQVDNYQGASVVNYADRDVPYTRIHEFKHFHPDRRTAKNKTVICKEYPKSVQHTADEPFFPMNTLADKKKYGRYRQRAEQEAHVLFGGRLADYKYYDMHQVIGSALTCYERSILPRLTNQEGKGNERTDCHYADF